MSNIIKLFDNIASSFNYGSGVIAAIGSTPGYNPINSSHVGSRVSYLARNVLTNGQLEFESGIGTLVSSGISIAVDRETIVSSSNNNNIVSFSTAGSKALYITSNEINNQNAFNNFVSVSDNFDIESYRTTYLIDLNTSNVTGTLPPATSTNAGLVIDFKTINSENTLVIIPSGSQYIDEENALYVSSDDYKRLISDGSGWRSLETNIVLQSGTPQGSEYSLQYNDGNGAFEGANIYTNPSHDLLIGDSSDYSSILRASGNTEFNVQEGDYNFIVHGNPGKNLYFDADGKLGINMPSNYVPQVPLHIFQNACAESIRVENRHSTNPSILTLYHRPSTVPVSGDIPSIINLAGKNDIANQTNYVSLKSKILDSSSVTSKGSFVVGVAENGGQETVIEISKYSTNIGSSNINSGSNTVVGRNNSISGSNSMLLGHNISYSGSDSVVIGRNHSIVLTDSSVEIQNSGLSVLEIVDNNLGIGKTPEVRLDVDGDVLASSIMASSINFTNSYPSGQLVLVNDQEIYVSDYNINEIIVGNTSGLLVKNGDVSASGLSDVYVDENGLNIDTDILLPNLSANSLLHIYQSKLTNYSYINLNTSSIDFSKSIKVNTTDTYTIDDMSPDILANGYVVTSGLVIDRNSVLPSGSVLVNVGSGKAQWKELNGFDLIFSNADMSWNKYEKRNATINSSTQITITDTILPEEFVNGDTIGVIVGENTYSTTITSQSIVNNNTVLILAPMGVSSGSCLVYSSTRGGYMNMEVPNGPTYNRFSIRPGTSTIFNGDKSSIDFGVYGSATNYALYINSSYNDNNIDESQVVINGSIPYNISEQAYATLTVNGSLYAQDIIISDNVDIDCGIIEFSGVV